MANISAKDVQALRERTGVGMMKCKEALVATEGDLEKAVTFLREQGLAVAAKKASRIAAEGIISLYNENNVGVLVEVNSETDFVAKNPTFKEFADGIAKVVAENNPADVAALLDMKFPGSDLTVEDMRKEKILVIGENINIRRFVIIENAAASYIHGKGNIGVVVTTDKIIDNPAFAEAAKNACLQAAAMKPQYLNPEAVPAEAVENEKGIIESQIKNDEKNAKKPEQVIAKMVEGKLRKFFSTCCLTEQEYVKDSSMTVGKYIASVAKEIGEEFTLSGFVMYEKGEGLEKKEDNFAEEIAKLTGK